MSTLEPQQQPIQPQQQPPVVYPNTVSTQPPSSHSNGSFGTAFIILAVIVVISAIACCLGRLCNRRQNKQKPDANKHSQKSQNKPYFRPKERESDLEFGFDKGLPTVRAPPNYNGGPRGHKPFGNGHSSSRVFEINPAAGDHHGEPKDHQGEPKAGP